MEIPVKNLAEEFRMRLQRTIGMKIRSMVGITHTLY